MSESNSIRVKIVIDSGSVSSEKAAKDLGDGLTKSLNPLVDRLAKKFGGEFGKKFGQSLKVAERYIGSMSKQWEATLGKQFAATARQLDQLIAKMNGFNRAGATAGNAVSNAMKKLIDPTKADINGWAKKLMRPDGLTRLQQNRYDSLPSWARSHVQQQKQYIEKLRSEFGQIQSATQLSKFLAQYKNQSAVLRDVGKPLQNIVSARLSRNIGEFAARDAASRQIAEIGLNHPDLAAARNRSDANAAEASRRDRVIADQQKLFARLQRAAEREAQDSERIGMLLRTAKMKGLAAAEKTAAAESKKASLAQQEAMMTRLAAQHAQSYLSAGNGILSSGFRRDSVTQNVDPRTGKLVTSPEGTYSRGAGIFRDAQSANLNAQGALESLSIEKGTSAWSRFINRVVGDGPRALQVLKGIGTVTSALQRTVSALPQTMNSFGNSLIRLAAVSYGIQRVAKVMGEAAVGPLRYVANETERGRQFQLSVANVVGGRAAATALDRQLLGESGKSGLSLDDLHEIARQMATTPQLATRLLGRDAAGQASQVKEFGSLVNQLAVMDPVQGAQGALVAIREGLAGDLQSLRRRLEISPNALAAVGGVTRDQLSSNPDVFLKALQKWTDTFVGRQAIEGRKDLLSTQVQRAKDLVGQGGAADVGNSGLYEKLVGRVAGFNNMLEQYLNSSKFKEQSSRISNLLISYVDGVVSNAQSFLEGLTNRKDLVGQIDSVITSVGNGFSRLVEVIKSIPDVSRRAGEGFAAILTGIGEFVDRLTYLGRAIKHLGPGALIPGSRQQRDFEYAIEVAGADPRSRDKMRSIAESQLRDAAYRDKRHPDYALQLAQDRADNYDTYGITRRQGAEELAAAQIRYDNYNEAMDRLSMLKDPGAAKAIASTVTGFSFGSDQPTGPGSPGWANQFRSGGFKSRLPGLGGDVDVARLREFADREQNFAAASSMLTAPFAAFASAAGANDSTGESSLTQSIGRIPNIKDSLDAIERMANASGQTAENLEKVKTALRGGAVMLGEGVENANLAIARDSLNVSAPRRGAYFQRMYGQLNDVVKSSIASRSDLFTKYGANLNLPSIGVPESMKSQILLSDVNYRSRTLGRGVDAASRGLDVGRIDQAIHEYSAMRVAMAARLTKELGAKEPNEGNINELVDAQERLDDVIADTTRQKFDVMSQIAMRSLQSINTRFSDAGTLRELGISGSDLSRIDPAQLRDSVYRSRTPAGLRQQAESQLRATDAAMPGQMDMAVDSIRIAQANVEKLKSMKAEPAVIQAASDRVREQIDVVRRLRDEWNQTTEALKQYGMSNADITEAMRDNWMQFAGDVRGAIESNISQGLSDVILKAGSFGDAMRNMGQQILRMYMDLQVRNLFMNLFGNAAQTPQGGGGGLFGNALGGIIGGIGNLFGGGALSAAGATTAASMVGTNVASGLSSVLPAFARGGIFSAVQPLGIKRYGAGGVVSGPQLAIIGDSVSNPNRPAKEGILPLAQVGGVLGVNATGMSGGGGSTHVSNHVVVVADIQAAARAAAQAEMNSPGGQVTIINALTGDVVRGGSSMKAIRTKMGR